MGIEIPFPWGDPGYIIAIICMQLSDLQRAWLRAPSCILPILFLAPYETLQRWFPKGDVGIMVTSGAGVSPTPSRFSQRSAIQRT